MKIKKLVGVLPRNAREELRVIRLVQAGRDWIHVQRFRWNGVEMAPTAQAISCPEDQAEVLAGLLVAAKEDE